MTLAFLEASARHASDTVVALPIREPPAATPCRNCSKHKCRVASLERRIAEIESRDLLELVAKQLVDEARSNVSNAEWASTKNSAKRKLCSVFHPDKLHVCPKAGEAIFKALCNDARW